MMNLSNFCGDGDVTKIYIIEPGTITTGGTNMSCCITGGTYLNGTLTLNSQEGDIIITGFTTNISGGTDTYVTGFTYNNANLLTLSQNQGQADLYVYLNTFTGLTINGLLATTAFQIPSGANTGYVLTSDGSGNGTWQPVSGASSGIDTYVTGFTYNANTLSINQNQGQSPLTVTLPNYLTGYTDNYVTGGTYTNGTLTLARQNGLVTISGFSTGGTATGIDTFVTGFTYNSNILTINQNEGQLPLSVTLPNFLTGYTDNYVTGGTYSNGTLTLNRQNGALTVPGFFTGQTFNDTYTTGFTYNANILSINQNQGQVPLTVILPTFITGYTDNYVTGGTYSNGTLTLARQNGLFTVTGFSTGGTNTVDTYVTGFTYNANILTISQNQGQPDLAVTLPTFITGYTDNYTTGFTYSNNILTITRNNGLADLPVTLPNYLTGYTDNYVTGGTYSNGTLTLSRQNGSFAIPGFFTGTTNNIFTGNTSASCITDLYISNLYGCSPITIHDIIKYTVGVPALGKVLTSDAVGNASWETLSAFITGFTDNFVTGFTYSNNIFTILRNNGLSNLTATIPNFLTGYTDNYVTGATYSLTSGILTISQQNGDILVSGLTQSTAVSGIYIFVNSASTIGGYYQARSLTQYAIGPIGTLTQNVTTTPTLLGSFATNLGYPNTTVIAPGQVNFHVDTQKAGGNQFYYVYFELYKIDTSNVETLLLTSENTTSNNSNLQLEQTTSAIVSTAIPLALTDRIVVKIYAVMTSSNANIDLLFDDGTNSGFELPLTILDSSSFVPYVNAQLDVNLGNKSLIANSLSATTYYNLPIDPDTYVTGFTYNSNVLTLDQNQGQSPLTVTLPNYLTGFTDTNDYVTGGTYNNGTLTLNRTNGSFNVTGFLTGSTGTDIYTTGGTYSNGTLTLNNNAGGSFNVTGFSTGGTSTGIDTYVTGFTYNNANVITLTQNQGQAPITVNIGTLGSISATTIYQNSISLDNTYAPINNPIMVQVFS